MMYADGRGVPKDYVLAHMWSNIAAAKGVKGASKNRNKMEKKMTQVQIATAQRLAREWKPDSMGAKLVRPVLGAHRG
jgi:TPR repeat protein